ncbi:MAG: DUF3431 domain-containing protein [Verrucomicrobiales bacterium]
MKVIARHNETITPQEGDFVVQKGEHLENVGREASSYLWFIVKHYHDLKDDEIYSFRQAREHEHQIGVFNFECAQNGAPHHGGLEIKRLADLIDLDIPEKIQFTAGAQFDVSGYQIKQRPIEWYVRAFDVSMSEPQAPWILERLWKYIFDL